MNELKQLRKDIPPLENREPLKSEDREQLQSLKKTCEAKQIEQLDQMAQFAQKMGITPAACMGLDQKQMRHLTQHSEDFLQKTRDLLHSQVEAQITRWNPYTARTVRLMPISITKSAFFSGMLIHSLYGLFPANKFGRVVQKTFDKAGLALNFFELSQTIPFNNRQAIEAFFQTPRHPHQARIFMFEQPPSERNSSNQTYYTLPAKIPEQIFCETTANNGQQAYATSLHELAHGLHFAYTSPKITFAKAFMGDLTVTETYALLMQNLFQNKHWLTQHVMKLKSKALQQTMENTALEHLYMLRFRACEMQFGLNLYDGKPYTEAKKQAFKNQLDHHVA